MATVCPKGHASSESDFCSVCGAKIAPAAAAHRSALCPDCGAESVAGINFCEVCGYNFFTGARGQIPHAAPPPAAPALGWKLLVSADATLAEPGSPAPPADARPVEIVLSKPVNVIGRGSASRAIYPEIALDLDDAVSHRHALIQMDSGALTLRDIGSTNGTRLNGTDLAPLVDAPLHDGDQITLGHWTRIEIKAVR